MAHRIAANDIECLNDVKKLLSYLPQNNSETTKKLKEKFQEIGQDLEVHLEGLLYSKPINYWDYIHTDTLLNLQLPLLF